MGHARWRFSEAGEDGEAGDGDQREVEGVAEALGGAEADADAGEGAGAVDDGYGVERVQGDASLRSEGVDGRDEALGGGAAGEGRNGGRAGGVGEGQAAGCATGVDEQNIQTVRPRLCGGLRGKENSVQVRAIGKPNRIDL